MNNRKLLYAPVLLYTFLLVAVWLVSWVTELYLSLSGSAAVVSSPINGPGLRWTLLSMKDSLNAAPWGTMALLVFVGGLLSGSGILQLGRRLIVKRKISIYERNSLLFALFALFLYCLLLFMVTVSPWNTLASVTGSFENSPLAHGWLLVLFLGVLTLSLVYGFIYGSYRTLSDVVGFSGDCFALYVPAFIAMIPASGIIPCLQYTGMDQALSFDEATLHMTANIVYVLPFVYIMVLRIIKGRYFE